MRKIATILLLIAALANTSFADDDFRKFRFGLKGAPNVSWIKPDATSLKQGGLSMKFSYGLMTEFGLSDNYYFATGVEVMTTGGGLTIKDTVGYYTTDTTFFWLTGRKYSFQYVDVPLTLKMRTNEIGYMRYFGQFGLNTSFRTKAMADDTGFPPVGGEVKREGIDITKEAQLFRVALNLGLGFEYNLVGNTALVVGVNYNNGFTNALRSTSKELFIPDSNRLNIAGARAFKQKATTNFVALTVGVMF